MCFKYIIYCIQLIPSFYFVYNCKHDHVKLNNQYITFSIPRLFYIILIAWRPFWDFLPLLIGFHLNCNNLCFNGFYLTFPSFWYTTRPYNTYFHFFAFFRLVKWRPSWIFDILRGLHLTSFLLMSFLFNNGILKFIKQLLCMIVGGFTWITHSPHNNFISEIGMAAILNF